ncbi:MAG TPA: GH92 family glycosyl hydrolase [Candidatus Krumholzibacteria bacterium]|nr:GH92 family glycosyl hydrolase [Candidatus Krumholzibacteria bacterium]
MRHRPLALAALLLLVLAAAAPAAEQDLVRFVDPFIGTDDSDSPHPVPGGAGGSCFPGASVPFGMVQLSPDTPTASPSGYRFGDTVIQGFSLTHFNGAGCPNNEDLPFLPWVGDVLASPGTLRGEYEAGVRKETEDASPGYYTVTFDNGVRTDLTATTRTGMVRFTYPATDKARMLLHTGRSATGDREGSVEVVGDRMLRGTVEAGGFCGSDTRFLIHFVMEFDRPFTGRGNWLGDAVLDGSPGIQGSPSGAYVSFDTRQDPVVRMKVGLSYVSVENAAANLRAENPGWDFDAVRAEAAARWNTVLNRIQVEGGTDADRTKFYTSLYHVFQNPTVAGDVNGESMGFDGKVHDYGRTMYQNFSGWDIIRSWTHLIAAVAPEADDILWSMVQSGVEAGLLPFWSHQNVETQVMVGDPGTVNVANAYAMGVRGFDAWTALDLMKRSADDPARTQRWGLADWLELGHAGNAAISLEYAMADHALGRYAESLGDADAGRYLERGGNWRNLWNPADGYLEPRAGATTMGGDATRIYEIEVFGAGQPGVNLAAGRPCTASGSCNRNEGPEKAVNGSWDGGTSDKWCDHSDDGMWWMVDLGAEHVIDSVVIHHAGAGGEPSAWNTQDYDITVSTDGKGFGMANMVRGNTADVSEHGIPRMTARYVRLSIITEIQRGVEQGEWDCQPFDPADMCGYVEGNGAQYLWMVPHDLPGLIGLMGGNAAAQTRLDHLFTELNAGTDRPHFYIGNEPEHGTPWTYNAADAPWKTQAVVRRIMDEEFGTGPGGLPGNDDLGATSAWYVWAALGLYPLIPGEDALELHGPLFPEARVTLRDGKVLTITGDGAGPDAPYVRGLTVDGREHGASRLRFGDIADGGTLRFRMAETKNDAWGRR